MHVDFGKDNDLPFLMLGYVTQMQTYIKILNHTRSTNIARKREEASIWGKSYRS